MNKRTFEQSFNAVFHDKEAFADFCNLDLQVEVQEFAIKDRVVYKTSNKLKKYLRFIDKVILKHLQRNEHVVHSYVKERSSLTAVQEHVKSKYFFITDIEDFFVNVYVDDVERILQRDKEMIPISDFEDYIPIIVKLTTWGGSIPIGFATSPQISNAFMFEFDSALEEMCVNQGLVYTRYSDDIVISADSPDALNELVDKVQNMLHEYASKKLALNEKKTKLTHIGNKVKILGLVITPDGSVTIDKKYKKTLETLLHFYINDKEKYDDLLRRELRGKQGSLFGLLHYAKSVDPQYVEKLQRKYGAYALSTLMENKQRDEV